jgi:hypothetical protein
MKQLISFLYLFVIVTSLIFGCTPDNPPPNPPANNGVAASWQATINGVSYNYSDTYTNLQPTNAQGNNEGECLYFLPTISLKKGGPFTAGDDIIISIQQPEILSVGTYNITTNNSPQMAVQVNNITVGHSFYPNTNVTLNITEVSATAGGLIKGNFSGVMGTSQSGGGTIPVSGQFQALRGI